MERKESRILKTLCMPHAHCSELDRPSVLSYSWTNSVHAAREGGQCMVNCCRLKYYFVDADKKRQDEAAALEARDIFSL